MSRVQELLEELKSVLSGRSRRLLDSFLPLVVFLVVTPIAGFNLALWTAGGVAALFAAYRLLRQESLVYALGGLGGVALAGVFAIVSGSGRGFFLPGLISGGITVILCVVSVAINRPVVAWTSMIVRRWPRDWYWHPQVLPAYNEVTIGWGVAFAARLVIELYLFYQVELGILGVARILLGWPFTITLLVVTYLYGIWRLRKLG